MLAEAKQCCPYIQISGFPSDYADLNGPWTRVEIETSRRTEYQKIVEGETYYINYNRRVKYEVEHPKNGVIYETQYMHSSECFEEKIGIVLLKTGSSDSIRLTDFECTDPPADPPTTTTDAPTTVTKAPTTTTDAPTATNLPCQSCRKVDNADTSLNGYYMLQGSGDNRCTMDGCLYQKQYTTDLYCFEAGVYNVQDECPPIL